LIKDKDLLGIAILPAPRLAWGFLLLAPVALTRGWPALLAETACALALALLSGKRFRPFANAGFLAAMIAFSLLQPRGEVLIQAGALPLVTRDALLEGIERGLRILCMVQISGFSVSASLRLPGAFGGLLSGVLSRFHALMDLRGRIDRKDIMGSVDRILFAVYDPRGETREAADGSDGTAQAAMPGAEGKTPLSRWAMASGIFIMAAVFAAASAAALLSRHWPR
jgi:hypothetical protein